MERNLKEIFDDLADSEVARSVVEAKVTERKDDRTFTISDGEESKTLEVDKKLEDKILVGVTYKFYSPEKLSQDRLRLNAKSFPKKLFESASNAGLKLRDLIGKKDKALIKENLAVKVLEKLQPRDMGGKAMR